MRAGIGRSGLLVAMKQCVVGWLFVTEAGAGPIPMRHARNPFRICFAEGPHADPQRLTSIDCTFNLKQAIRQVALKPRQRKV